ncbi:topoisomerase DNA-binding C4 zinc finger domain-containing protein [Robbsia andropogonis]|nr:type I DNA topoisomerase [Robbsia andropogonis]
MSVTNAQNQGYQGILLGVQRLSCGAPLRRRESQRGAFWGCSTFPDCKQTLPDDGDGKPLSRRTDQALAPPPKKAASAQGTTAQSNQSANVLNVGSACPDCCRGKLVLRAQKNTGRSFLGCNSFPSCRFFKWSAQNMP